MDVLEMLSQKLPPGGVITRVSLDEEARKSSFLWQEKWNIQM